MKAIVIYDSWFGNTEHIAAAIAHGIGKGTRHVNAGDANAMPERLHGYDLVVIGCPTHGGTVTPLMHAYLSNLHEGHFRHKCVAAFDTRSASKWVKVFGYAAKALARKLMACESSLVVPPEGFHVRGKEGPLADGELERAEEWGSTVSRRAELGLIVSA